MHSTIGASHGKSLPSFKPAMLIGNDSYQSSQRKVELDVPVRGKVDGGSGVLLKDLSHLYMRADRGIHQINSLECGFKTKSEGGCDRDRAQKDRRIEQSMSDELNGIFAEDASGAHGVCLL